MLNVYLIACGQSADLSDARKTVDAITSRIDSGQVDSVSFKPVVLAGHERVEEAAQPGCYDIVHIRILEPSQIELIKDAPIVSSGCPSRGTSGPVLILDGHASDQPTLNTIVAYPCVIEVPAGFDAESRVAFAATFYETLTFGYSIQTAFWMGCCRTKAPDQPEMDSLRMRCAAGFDPRVKPYITSPEGDVSSEPTGAVARTDDTEAGDPQRALEPAPTRSEFFDIYHRLCNEIEKTIAASLVQRLDHLQALVQGGVGPVPVDQNRMLSSDFAELIMAIYRGPAALEKQREAFGNYQDPSGRYRDLYEWTLHAEVDEAHVETWLREKAESAYGETDRQRRAEFGSNWRFEILRGTGGYQALSRIFNERDTEFMHTAGHEFALLMRNFYAESHTPVGKPLDSTGQAPTHVVGSPPPGIGIWLDCFKSVQQAWDKYVAGRTTESIDLSEKALEAADAIAGKNEMEVGQMVEAYRSQAAACVVRGCALEKADRSREALESYARATTSPGEGIVALLRALTGDKTLVGPWIELAASLTELDLPHEAIYLLESLDLDKVNDEVLRTEAYWRLGEAYCAVASYEDAARSLDAAIKLDPDRSDGELYGSRGWVQLCRGNFEAARKDFEVALANRPKNWWWRRGLGDACDGLRDPKAAVHYEQAISDIGEEPSNLDAASFCVLAWCFNRLDEHEEAFRQILNSVVPGAGLLYNQFDRAMIVLHLGVEAALHEYKRSVNMLASKPIPRRVGLLSQAYRNFKQEVARSTDGFTNRAEIEEIERLLLAEISEAATIWETVRSCDATLWSWIVVNKSLMNAYAFLSDYKNYKEFTNAFTVDDDPSQTGSGDKKLKWTVKGAGLDREWTTEKLDLSPYYRICYFSLPTKDMPRDGVSWTTYLLPISGGTLVLVRLMYDSNSFSPREQAALKAQLDADLKGLSAVNSPLAVAG